MLIELYNILQNMWIVWLIIAGISLLAAAIRNEINFMFIGVGAAAAGLSAIYINNIGWQSIIFVFITIILIASRPESRGRIVSIFSEVDQQLNESDSSEKRIIKKANIPAIYDMEMLKEAVERKDPRIIVKGELAQKTWKYVKASQYLEKYFGYAIFAMFFAPFAFLGEIRFTINFIPLPLILGILLYRSLMYKVGANYEIADTNITADDFSDVMQDQYIDLISKPEGKKNWYDRFNLSKK